MIIIRSSELTEEQKRQITELEQVCYEKAALENHLFLSNEINYDKRIPTFFLAYEGAELIGFLTFFIPTREEAEISAIVRPDWQRRGVFTELDKAAREVIAENEIKRILYSVETKSETAALVLRHWGISRILRSEYRMKLDKSRIKRDCARSVTVDFFAKRVTPENISDYMEISNRVYGDEDSEYADTVMTSETRLGYVVYADKMPVGIFAVGLETAGEPFIYGVAVTEKERGKGYGRLLMEEACKIGAEYGDALWLDVDSENPVAFHLYKSIGFEVSFQVDYYAR